MISPGASAALIVTHVRPQSLSRAAAAGLTPPAYAPELGPRVVTGDVRPADHVAKALNQLAGGDVLVTGGT